VRLSLVIPCYNEAKSLPQLVARAGRVVASGDVQVVLVDNGSTDDSPAVMADLLASRTGVRSVRVDVNQGYGHGILTGLRAAAADGPQVLGWTHADLQTDPLDALRGLALFEDLQSRQGGDPERLFVKGRRYGRPLGDTAFTVGMSAFETALLRRPLWDINAQPTLFPASFFAGWVDPPTDFSLDLYGYHRAVDSGMQVARFAVSFGARQHGVSSWNVDWRSKAKFIRRTTTYSLALRRSIRGRALGAPR
jgi:glycosyltransferase involved in cell wall biosynthesis